MDRSGVIQPHLQYNNNKEFPNMDATELNIMQGRQLLNKDKNIAKFFYSYIEAKFQFYSFL